MNCSPFDLRDYFLQELPDPQQRQVEAHVKTCQPCREDLDRLRVTECALLSLRDEEIPQRIAFVSDRIFEPSPFRRWWTAFWGSAARLGFASAAMLSAAIVVYAVRPVTPPINTQLVGAAPASQQVIQTISDTEIQSRVDTAVSKALAEVEERQSEKTKTLVSELQSMQRRLQVAATVYELDEKRANNRRMAASGYGGPHDQEVK
jgi:anti-sigma factor RsiW